ncbi:hypothetical protein SKAU_G00098410 [Synaphobranchus kaupii]|uniref:Ig-like domain-containing protein n=1 Tax=Synaphobranchus kaupii TaxID=118154 RepID=A0A9Q1J774_SYNKA|nr:hypothetical protein SKAU_G00098410 [Synaphobranchus kaupii]
MMMRSERLLGLLLLLRTVVSNDSDTGECSLEIQPSTVVVRHADPVSVNCTVSGDHVGIGWEASEGSVDMVTDVQFVTWSLETVTDWEIAPRCFGNFPTEAGPPSQCEKKIIITLYKPPDSVSISAVNHTGPMVEREEYQLQCVVQNIAPVQYLTVKWYKGETLENQTSYDYLTKTPVNVSSTLLITPTSADDGAQYSCVAELKLGPEGPQPPPSITSEPLTITVHYKPRITGCSDHMELGEGETLDTLVSCRAKGNPSPMVTWYRDQSEFNSSTPLARRDGGQYTLIANNTQGTANRTLEIEVLYKPRITGCSDHVELREGVTLDTLGSCKVEGYPSPVVTWYRDQSEFNSSTPLTRRDGGQYTLIAENAQGTANHTLEIEVLYKPRITGCPNHVELREGVTLDTLGSCTVEGNPFPVVTWYRDQFNFSSSTPLTKIDGGQYTLIAENTQGTANHTLEIEVLSDTRECSLEIQPSTVVVRHADPVSVNCTVLGDHLGIGWEASEGSVDMVTDVQFVTWSLETVTDWEMAPRCFGNFPTKAGPPSQCDEKINITLYKPPDSVSISAVNHTGPVVEGEKYQLQCEVQNIAPVQYLTVKWYKGGTLENQTSYDDLTKTPVNVSSTLLITPTSTDDGAQYSCVAELELGPEGPQPPPSITSEPLTITVHYKPLITGCSNHVELREGVTLDTLVSCTVEGNPSPKVTWYKDQSAFDISTQLTRGDGGQYTLKAENAHGTANHTLEVEVPFDYLHVWISIFFIVLTVIVVILVLLRRRLCPQYRGHYRIVPPNSTDIPLLPINGNGTTSCTPEPHPPGQPLVH